MAEAKEEIGQFFGKGRVYEQSKLASLDMQAVEATFEQIPYIFEAGIKAQTTATTADAGSGKVYTYAFGMTAANALSTYTIEAGDNQRVDEMEYAYVEKFSLAGATKEALKMSATWAGRQMTDAEFTTTATVPTVEEILFAKGKLFIDTSGGTIGTTQKTTTWLGIQIDVDTGNNAIWSGDGNSYYTFVKNVGASIKGKMTLEHDTFGEAELGFARTGAARLVRMIWLGTALTTTGTTHTTKKLIFDSAIVYDNVPDVADKDGNDTVVLSWHSVDAGSIVPTFTVVNQLATLP
jgi:hypothetical protein